MKNRIWIAILLVAGGANLFNMTVGLIEENYGKVAFFFMCTTICFAGAITAKGDKQ